MDSVPVYEIRYKKNEKEGRYWIMGNNEQIWSEVDFFQRTKTSQTVFRTIQRNAAAVSTSKMGAAVIIAPAVTNAHVQSCK